MNKLLAIVGPTATGKTKLALSLAKEMNGELISCDSRQVYTGMDIGTGKDLTDKIILSDLSVSINFHDTTYTVTPYQEQRIPIWMLDVVTPDQEFSVSQYQSLAVNVIEDIISRGKLPILVGGTGFYYHAVTQGVDSISISPDTKLRSDLYKQSVTDLQHILQTEAQSVWESMNQSDKQNPRRLVRKIELVRSGFTFTKQVHSLFNLYTIGLALPKEQLNTCIAQRVQERVKKGSIEEVKRLREHGYSFSLPSMHTMGYLEWESYIANQTDQEKEKAIHLWILHEIQYAKKQMTWFNHESNIHWVPALDAVAIQKAKEDVRVWYTKQ